MHVCDIFLAADLCDAGTSDYQLFRTLCRVATYSGVTPYTADKVIWLIGSGFFYKHPHVGNDGRIAGTKAQFIELLKSKSNR